MWKSKNRVSRFAAFEGFDYVFDDDDVDISTAWESIVQNIKSSATDSVGYYAVKHHKSWFDDKC
jgi:hypothetical protein